MPKAGIGYQNVSLKDEDIEELKDIAKDMGVDQKAPVAIRALIRWYQKDTES